MSAHRIVTIDLPGIGGSSPGGTSGSKVGIARLVHGLVDALDLTDVTLVGLNTGGIVTYAYLCESRPAPRRRHPRGDRPGSTG
jgi:pimeloyl-ACP methyl ester carboxylesterase